MLAHMVVRQNDGRRIKWFFYREHAYAHAKAMTRVTGKEYAVVPYIDNREKIRGR